MTTDYLVQTTPASDLRRPAVITGSLTNGWALVAVNAGAAWIAVGVA